MENVKIRRQGVCKFKKENANFTDKASVVYRQGVCLKTGNKFK